ncbi:MAG TPA: S8 family serine peptidase, partial [Hyphomicrobiaceae bacterium]|nr:S8 family serine peptidase [Hyphomicrobiaceae bacterium]
SAASEAELRNLLARANQILLDGIPATSERRAEWAVRTTTSIPVIAATLNRAEISALASSGRVKRIWPDRVFGVELKESLGIVAGASPGGDLAAIEGADGRGTTIAVIDSGIDTTHPFLAGRIVREACFSTPSGPGASSFCGTATTLKGAGAGKACTGIASCSHGTHVAGIVAGDGSSLGGSAPARGMAPKAKIMAIQVFHRVDSAEDCAPLAAPCTLASTSDLLAAFDYILGEVAGLAEPLAAINMSVGGGEGTGPCNDTPLARVVQSLRARGVATVFSAGNSGFRNSTNDGTSCVEAAFSIGATTKDDLVSPFSNMSPIVDLLAPGSGIMSSVIGGSFQAYDGTSFAAPHVAGAIAAIRSRHPRASLDAIEAALKVTGPRVSDQRPEGQHAKPRIRVDLALRLLAGDANVAASRTRAAPSGTTTTTPKGNPAPAPGSATPATPGCDDVSRRASGALTGGTGDAARCN